ncbi:hypothetical protein CW613_003987 [Vibrio mimicus]
MKKIDLHIHTVYTVTDPHFEFSMDTIKKYVSSAKLDCIAITNHNVFDIEQYKAICDELDIMVLPGIEVDLERGHILIIANPSDLDDFNIKCKQLSQKVNPYPRPIVDDYEKPNINYDDFCNIYSDLNKYILIPHYDKTPKINSFVLNKLNNHITTGEVQSAKKFIQMHSDENKLVPVYFSDERMSHDKTVFPSRQTFLNIDNLDFRSIKLALKNKNFVSLSKDEGNNYIELLDTGIKLSTKLNVILGKRSSGKTHLLKLINNNSGEDKVKYIKQFELLEPDDNKDKANFDELVSRNESSYTDGYLHEFKNVVDDILNVNILDDEKNIERYIDSLVENAQNQARSDIYSKAYLFNESKYNYKDSVTLKELIKSIHVLLDSFEYKQIITRNIDINSLISLHNDLISQYKMEYKNNQIQYITNDIISDVKSLLNIKSSLKIIEDLDLSKIALNRVKKRKFEQVVNAIKEKKLIAKKELHGYNVVAERSPFENATALQQVASFRTKLVPSFKEYDNPMSYITKLKEAGIEDVEVYKFFTKITYRILNKFGTDVSGGERSEYRLLRTLNDANNYDILLIDEPESSFDNIFLLESINSIIKDLSSKMPVVLVTHNSTVGASIVPDNIIYTSKTFTNGTPCYEVYTGKPTDKFLRSPSGSEIENYQVQINSLEAGATPYEKRRKDYDDIKS